MAANTSDILEVLPHTNNQEGGISEFQIVRCESTGNF